MMDKLKLLGMFDPDDIVSSIENVPKEDVVEIVRCKDCIWYIRESGCPMSYGKFEDINGNYHTKMIFAVTEKGQ